MTSDERFRMTDEGAAMQAELSYGHNPRAYLCSERPSEQPPASSEELCVLCADGFEALNWKRKALNARTELAQKLRKIGDEFDEAACRKGSEAQGEYGRGRDPQGHHAMGMCDAYGNTAELLWATASHMEAEDSGDALGFMRRFLKLQDEE